MIYDFIWKHPEHTVAKWARFFKVTRSGYYAYIERRERREKEEQAKKAMIKRVFEESNGTYGPDRICGVIRRNGGKASYGKVSGYMAEMGLQSIHNRHRTRSLTDSRKARGKAIQTSSADRRLTSHIRRYAAT